MIFNLPEPFFRDVNLTEFAGLVQAEPELSASLDGILSL